MLPEIAVKCQKFSRLTDNSLKIIIFASSRKKSWFTVYYFYEQKNQSCFDKAPAPEEEA
jgi:hypothetical protein